jgi:hypothetical protein
MAFERIRTEQAPLTGAEKQQRALGADEGAWDMLLDEREPAAEQQLEFAHAIREAALESLVELGRMRARQKRVKTDEFQTLRFMIQNGYLKEPGRRDVNSFLKIKDVVRDEALSQMALLRETDKLISLLEAQAGYTEEEIASRGRVRGEHASTYEAEWGVS